MVLQNHQIQDFGIGGFHSIEFIHLESIDLLGGLKYFHPRFNIYLDLQLVVKISQQLV